MKLKLFRMTHMAIANVTILALVVVMAFGSSLAFAQVAMIDPALEVFRIRCQIDVDIDAVTGAERRKVQIQTKIRTDLLEGYEVGIGLENITRTVTPLPPNVVFAVFNLGTASADWDTLLANPDPLNPQTFVDGGFVVGGESIKVTAQVTSTGQTVTDVGKCVEKTGQQFKQQTKGVCKLKDFNRGKCKSGEILPDGTVMP